MEKWSKIFRRGIIFMYIAAHLYRQRHLQQRTTSPRCRFVLQMKQFCCRSRRRQFRLNVFVLPLNILWGCKFVISRAVSHLNLLVVVGARESIRTKLRKEDDEAKRWSSVPSSQFLIYALLYCEKYCTFVDVDKLTFMIYFWYCPVFCCCWYIDNEFLNGITKMGERRRWRRRRRKKKRN